MAVIIINVVKRPPITAIPDMAVSLEKIIQLPDTQPAAIYMAGAFKHCSSNKKTQFAFTWQGLQYTLLLQFSISMSVYSMETFNHFFTLHQVEPVY